MWRVPEQMFGDLASLCLYDTLLLVDDSACMAGALWQECIGIAQKLISLSTAFDDDGIEMMFFNSSVQGFSISTPSAASKLLHDVTPGHASTSIAQALYNRVSTLVLKILQTKKTLDKPILVYIITSGAANAAYDGQHLAAVISGLQQMMRDFKLPHECISFQLLQVAQDPLASHTFAQLDAQFANVVDTTGPYWQQQQACARKGVNLTPELYIIKSLLGAIDPMYDNLD